MKIWAISDTHHMHSQLTPPDGIDMVILSGDESHSKIPAINSNELLDFLEWFNWLPYQHKIWVAGNHSTAIEARLIRPLKYIAEKEFNIHYLENSGIEIEGINIWGSPYTPSFGTGWAFNRDRSKLHKTWGLIPKNTNILVTHAPPHSILDFATDYASTGRIDGCKSLLREVKKIQPKYHIFGHMHEQGGQILKTFDCETTYINAATANLRTDKLVNNGIIFNY